MLLLVASNCILGALVGIRHRVWIVIPLPAIAIIEVALLDFRDGTWISMLWHTGALITALELGYLAGSAMSAYLSDPGFPVTARRWGSARIRITEL